MTDRLSPETCASLDDVRAGIDALDRRLVALLAERSRYVVAAARFKRSASEVQARERVEQVVAQVRALALHEDASPDVIECIYRTVITAMTELEHRQWGRT